VIGIAAGSNKVETIIAGARTGLLHLLITDEPTATAALALISGGIGPGSAAAL
jgi:DNA-binding transcriptional regulator LsrR (DeoR family)